MLHWNLDDRVECSFNEMQWKIQQLTGQYKIAAVINPKVLDQSRNVIIEVWFNFQTQQYIIMTHSKSPDEVDERPTI